MFKRREFIKFSLLSVLAAYTPLARSESFSFIRTVVQLNESKPFSNEEFIKEISQSFDLNVVTEIETSMLKEGLLLDISEKINANTKQTKYVFKNHSAYNAYLNRIQKSKLSNEVEERAFELIHS